VTRVAKAAAREFEADDLLRAYEVYDQAVDVVSCYQWVFTRVAELAATVEHFERYPKLTADGSENTPDFTVLFTDRSGLAGEIARLAQHEKSVESLCNQITRYASLPHLPSVTPTPTSPAVHGPVDVVDVLVLTPVKTVKDAARRIFEERLDDPEHDFSPARRPIVVQFSQNGGEYVFLFWPTGNGQLHRGSRGTVYGDIDPFTCRPEWFTPLKAQYGFMNDAVPALYMATRLWTNVLPNRFWSDQEVTVPIKELVEAVREVSEGFGRANDVRRGMRVLAAAGLARETKPDKEWKVKRQSLRRGGEADVHTAIAERIRKAKEALLLEPVTRTPIRRGRVPQVTGQESLFEIGDGEPRDTAQPGLVRALERGRPVKALEGEGSGQARESGEGPASSAGPASSEGPASGGEGQSSGG
jgi:hypothetical protein